MIAMRGDVDQKFVGKRRGDGIARLFGLFLALLNGLVGQGLYLQFTRAGPDSIGLSYNVFGQLAKIFAISNRRNSTFSMQTLESSFGNYSPKERFVPAQVAGGVATAISQSVNCVTLVITWMEAACFGRNEASRPVGS